MSYGTTPPGPYPGFYQVAYVTNDFERALALCGETHGIRAFQRHAEMHYPTRDGREAVCDLAFAFVGATQIEVIHPVKGDVQIYRDFLPSEGFAFCFHHIAKIFDTVEAIERQIAAYEAAGRPLPINASVPEYARYFYADFRPELGHYIEGVMHEPKMRARIDTIPRN